MFGNRLAVELTVRRYYLLLLARWWAWEERLKQLLSNLVVFRGDSSLLARLSDRRERFERENRVEVYTMRLLR